MKQINRIVYTMFRNGYFDLNHLEIDIKFKYMDDFFMFVRPSKSGGYCVYIDFNLIGAPRNVLQGFVAHEFSHIVIDESRNLRELKIAYRLYNTSKRFVAEEEKKADLVAITRGYGRQLLASKVWRKNQDYSLDGLTMEEIRNKL